MPEPLPQLEFRLSYADTDPAERAPARPGPDPHRDRILALTTVIWHNDH